jgi:hypothetical protein
MDAGPGPREQPDIQLVVRESGISGVKAVHFQKRFPLIEESLLANVVSEKILRLESPPITIPAILHPYVAVNRVKGRVGFKDRL